MDIVRFHNDFNKLIEILPSDIVKFLGNIHIDDVIEIVLDLGRNPEIRHSDGKTEYIDNRLVTDEDLIYITSLIPPFTHDNRSGLPGTLHRISAIRNRQGKVVGLTCRIGRVVTGTIECIKDFVMQNKSILFLGRPGVGKTTKLREISRLVSDELNKRVVIIDTSNEIAGDGDTPHPAIGRARRMQVPQPEMQKDIMIEAVENHTPEVIVVDEIGTEAEAQAARTIAERGVMLIATAHGNNLESLIKNPILSDLVGGVSSVTLGDDEAKRRGSQKTVLEREKQPTFDIVMEIVDRNTLAVYKNTAEAVDYILRGWPVRPEIRKVDEGYQEKNIITEVNKLDEKINNMANESLKFSFSRQEYVNQVKDFKKIYIYAVSRTVIEKVIERLDLHAEITRKIEDADVVIAHKAFSKNGNKILSTANDYRLPIYYVRSNSMAQIQKVVKEALKIEDSESTIQGYCDDAEKALDEAEKGVEKVLKEGVNVELKPQNQQIRKLQHEFVEQNNLTSESIGEEDNRHVIIFSNKNDNN
ncbi:single-stranded DNA-binding protein [bacterium]|nr:single-stranded DNA-binding protein [bacterium]